MPREAKGFKGIEVEGHNGYDSVNFFTPTQ